MRFVWASLGILCIALAMVGVVLPLLPTVPFLLLAAFFFARSSSRMHNWLVTHPAFGPIIEDWNRSGVIRVRAKRLATLSIMAVLLISIVLKLPIYIITIQGVTLCMVMLFIWTRPSD